MNNRVISALTLAMALAVSSTAASAQSTATPLPDGFNQSSSQLPEGFNEASTERPEGYDTAGSVRPEGYEEGSANSAKPEGYGTDTGPGLSDDMKSMVDGIVKEQQGQLLSGDEGSACEAIICLSTGGAPSECAAALRKYFSINLNKPWKTIQARINFLKMCPASNESPQMGTLVEAIGRGAGQCDAATLNQTLRTWTGSYDDRTPEISNQMPSHCNAYFTHEYTDINSTKPRYVDKYVVRTYKDSEGNTMYDYDGGYWVDGSSTAGVAANNANGAVSASKDRAAVGF